MITSKFFIDSNIILYLLDKDYNKRVIAEGLLAQLPHINSQVIVEVANVCRKKFNYTKKDILDLWNAVLSNCIFAAIDKSTIQTAIYIAKKYELQLFDSIIIAGALLSNCTVLYSEDLQHNQKIEGMLSIINPFI